MTPDDLVDMTVLDVASKVCFGTVDAARRLRHGITRLGERWRAARAVNPGFVDQLTLVAVAAALEILAAIVRRRG